MALDMTQGKEWKHILRFALPIMAGQLLQQLYNTVDGIVVGNFISSNALAAVGGCTSLTMAFTAMAIGMSNGSGVVISQYFGAGKKDEMRKGASTSLIMLFVLGLFFTILGMATSGFIMKRILVIEEADICRDAAIYFRIYSLGLVFQFLYNCVASILRSVGDSKATLYFLLISTVSNMILDTMFVVVFHWGVAGTAIATVIAQAACMVASIIYMMKKYPNFRFKLNELKYDSHKAGQCFKMGIPSTIQMLVVSCGNVVLQRLVNSFGSVTMAAYTVGLRFDHYLSVPPMSLSNAMATFSGQNTGAGKTDRIKRGIKGALVIDAVMTLVLCILLYAFAAPCGKLFGVSGETLAQSVHFLRFVSSVYLIFALYVPFGGLFQGAGNPNASMCASFIALGTKVLSAYAMVYLFNVGHTACWTCNLPGWTMAFVYALTHYLRGRWKNRGLQAR